MNDEVSPVDRVLDLAFYAPVGLAMAALEGLPHWAEIGRRQVEARLQTARVVGRLVVDQGSRQSGEVLRRVAQQADKAMSGLGLVPEQAEERPAGSVPEQRPAGSVPERNAGSVPEEPAPAGPEPTVSAPDAAVPSPPAGSAPVGLDPAQLAIPGYDTLSASQVVQRLPGLSADELQAVRVYEMAGRARKTVLLKAAQLQNGP
ncbi:MAG: hypothetical protein M3011_03000 [Actinomycetota bacterium]|nr:hypothetical protein [Actinomycetota bacterium]